MKRTSLIVVAVVVLAAGAAWWWWGRASDSAQGGVDLVEAFRAAEKSTGPGLDPASAFSMDPQTIAGETKPSIFAHPRSRITFHGIQVPEDAQLEAWLGIKEDAWDKGTDGVYFRLGVSLGEEYKDLITRSLDPYRVPADRGWVHVTADLSAYAGQKVNVVLNTHPSPPGGNDNGMYDFAVFGVPRIVVRSGR